MRIVILFLVFLQNPPAAPSHIDFTKDLLGVDGKPLPNVDIADPKKSPGLTLGDVAVGALEASLEADKGTGGAEKFKLDTLARKVYKNKDAVLEVEEISLIKTRIGQ